MKLVYLPVNAAWVFVFGKRGTPVRSWSPTRMGDFPMFFADRQEAVDAAEHQGLLVEDDGTVRTPHSGGMLNGLDDVPPLRWATAGARKILTRFVGLPGDETPYRAIVARGFTTMKGTRYTQKGFYVIVAPPTAVNAMEESVFLKNVKSQKVGMALVHAMLDSGELELR